MKHSLLVVEDDEPTRAYLSDNLTADGYKVACATGAAEARVMRARVDNEARGRVFIGVRWGDPFRLRAEPCNMNETKCIRSMC